MHARFTRCAALLLACCLAPASVDGQDAVRTGFERLDRNGDGRLDRDEISSAAAFRQLDRNSDGAVTLEEAQATFRGLDAAGRRRLASMLGRVRPADPDVQALRRQLNIPYLESETEVGANLVSLDIYAPEDADALPVMIYVHGGGWRRGDKAAVAEKPAFFAGQGMLLVSVNYRLIPEGRHPVNVQDVAAAIAWVHDHIGEHGGDPERLFLMGHSAGAHLVALVATDHRRLAAHGKDPAMLLGVVANDTQAYDLNALLSNGGGSDLHRSVFGETAEQWRDASPRTHVVEDRSYPAFLIIHNMQNASGPSRAAQANGLAEALRDAGSEARVVGVPERTHGQLNQWLGRSDEVTTREVLQFLHDQLTAVENGAD